LDPLPDRRVGCGERDAQESSPVGAECIAGNGHDLSPREDPPRELQRIPVGGNIDEEVERAVGRLEANSR
jgi:hypothetical protein